MRANHCSQHYCQGYKSRYGIKNGVDTEKCEKPQSDLKIPEHDLHFSSRNCARNCAVACLKGRNKSESSPMTCEAELHCWVSRMTCSILSLIARVIGIGRKVGPKIMGPKMNTSIILAGCNYNSSACNYD